MNRSQQQQKQPQQKQQQQKQQKQQQQKQQQQHQKPVAGPLSGVSRLARGKASASSATQSKVDRLSAGGSAVGPNVRTSAALSKPSRPSDPHGRRLNTSNRPSSRPSDPSGFGGMPPARGSGKLKMSMLPRGTRDFGNKVSNSNKHGNEENGMGNPRKQSSRVSIRLTPGRAPPLIESPYARGGRQQSSIAAATHHPSPGLPSTPQRRLDLQPTEPRAPDRPLDYTFSQSDSYQEDPAMSTSFTSTVSNGGSSNSGIHGARGFPASVLANPAATAGDDRHLSTGSVERLSSTSTGSTRQRVSALESFRAARRASLQKAEKESNLSGRKVKDLSKSGQCMTSQNGSDCGTDLGDDDRPSCDTNNTENISDPDRFSEETEQDSYGIPLPPPPANDFAQRLEAAAHSPPNPTSQRWLGADQCVDSYTSNANQFNSSTVSPLQSSVGSGRLSNGFPDDQRDMLPDRPEVSIRSGMSMTNAIAVMGMLPDRHDTSLSADGGRMKRRKNSRFSDIEEEIDLGNVQKLRCSLRGRRSMADAHETPKLRRSSVGISVTGNIKVDNALDSLPHGQQQLGSSQLHQPYTGLDNRSSSISSRQPLRSIVSNASDTAEFDVDVDVSSPTTGSLRHSQRRSSAVVGDNDKSAAGSEDTARHITGGSDHSSYSTFSTAVFRSRFGHLTKLDEADFGLENEDDVEDLADSLHE